MISPHLHPSISKLFEIPFDFVVENHAIDLGNSRFLKLPYYRGKFWSESSSTPNIHQLSYRACFKPALVSYLIKHLSEPGDIVYDPFAGRGTVPVEAAYLGRRPVWSDVNPISFVYTLPRIRVPSQHEVLAAFDEIDIKQPMLTSDHDPLLQFFHPSTLNELLNIRHACLQRIAEQSIPHICILMLLASRLHGNSDGYLSTYTMPASQAVSINRQEKINEKYIHTPTYRSTRKVLVRKYQLIYRNTNPGDHCCAEPEYHIGSADSVNLDCRPNLIITSPPFIDEVDYKGDNWLRCWLLGVESKDLPIWQTRSVEAWRTQMTGVLFNLHKNSAEDAILCWETGEVRQGTIDLAQHSAAAAHSAGWKVYCCLIHEVEFSKVSATYGVSSNEKGTNTNRVLIAYK